MEVITRTYYRVAEHLFAVESSNTVLLQCMTNYEPFSVDPKLDAELIFVLKVEQNGLLCDEQRSAYQHVFTDNSEDDMPRIEVYRSLEKDWLIRISQIATSPICCELACNGDFTHGQLYIAGDCQDVPRCRVLRQGLGRMRVRKCLCCRPSLRQPLAGREQSCLSR